MFAVRYRDRERGITCIYETARRGSTDIYTTDISAAKTRKIIYIVEALLYTRVVGARECVFISFRWIFMRLRWRLLQTLRFNRSAPPSPYTGAPFRIYIY